MKNLADLKEIIQRGRISSKWQKILDFTKEERYTSEAIQIVEQYINESTANGNSFSATAKKYMADHPLFKYSTTYYGKLPLEWSPQVLSNIRHFYLSGEGIKTNEGIAKMQHLKNAELINIDSTQADDISSLFTLSKVTELKFSFSFNIQTIKGIKKMTQLDTFSHMPNDNFDIESLQELTMITSLDLGGGSLSEIGDLSKLTNLKSLSLDWNPIKTLAGIQKLKKLRKLLCFNCSKLEDISSLTTANAIEYLNLFGCIELKNIASLSGLKKLYYLQLEQSSNIDVKPRNQTLNDEGAIKVYLKKIKKHYAKTSSPKSALPESKLDKATLAIIQKLGKITFTELIQTLDKEGFTTKGSEKFSFEKYDTVLIWNQLSEQLISSLKNLESLELIKFEKLQGNFDGVMYLDRTSKDHPLRKYPLAKRKMKYKDERWMPHWIVDVEYQVTGGLSFSI